MLHVEATQATSNQKLAGLVYHFRLQVVSASEDFLKLEARTAYHLWSAVEVNANLMARPQGRR